MHPAVFDGVTNKEERNGGAYSKTKRFTISNAKILVPDQRCETLSQDLNV
jgi:hypothetical protein